MFLESYGILGEDKAGSRKNYGTNDHIFNLRCLIDLFLFKKKKLFCAYRLQILRLLTLLIEQLYGINY